MKQSIKTTLIEISLLTIIGFGLALTWSGLIPAGSIAPDEDNHASVAEFIAKNHRLPEFNREPELIQTSCQPSRDPCYVSEAFHPPLTYLIYSLPRLIAGEKTYSYALSDLMPMRILSGFFYTIYLIFIYFGFKRFFRKFFSNNQRNFLFPFLIAGFLPTLIFLSGYVNIDIFSLMASAIAFFASLKLLTNLRILNSWLFFGAALAILAQAKPTYLILLLILTVWIIFKAVREKKVNFYGIAFAFVIFLAVNLPWWWRNFQLFGDPLLTQTVMKIIRAGPLEQTAYGQGFGLFSLAFDKEYLTLIYRSSIALLGPWTFSLPQIYYTLSGYLFVLLIILACSFLIIKKTNRDLKILMLCSLAGLIVLHLLLANRSLFAYQPQGRYYYPLLIPLAIFFSFGLNFIKKNVIPYLIILLGILVAYLNFAGMNIFSNLYWQEGIVNIIKKGPSSGLFLVDPRIAVLGVFASGALLVYLNLFILADRPKPDRQ